MTYQELKAKLAALEAELAATRAEGEILLDARIDSSILGGRTVRGQPAVQYRLRIKGQPAQYLPASKVASTRAAIARGKRIRLLARERERVQGQLECLIQKAAELGLELPK